MTMALHVHPNSLADGSSSRQWPFSRALYPKQLLALSGDQTLFHQATQRLMDLTGNDIHVAPPCIVGNEEHRFSSTTGHASGQTHHGQTRRQLEPANAADEGKA